MPVETARAMDQQAGSGSSVVDRLTAGGQPVEWDTGFPGFRRVHAHDPFDNRLEFLQPVP
ncbi:MAG: hypothetical protein ACR2LX_09230 [Jatrophihabitans sp.]